MKSKLVDSITAKLEIAKNLAKTTDDRKKIDQAMSLLAEDKLDEAQLALDQVDNQDLTQEKLNA